MKGKSTCAIQVQQTVDQRHVEPQAHVLILGSVHTGARSLALGLRNTVKDFSFMAVGHGALSHYKEQCCRTNSRPGTCSCKVRQLRNEDPS